VENSKAGVGGSGSGNLVYTCFTKRVFALCFTIV